MKEPALLLFLAAVLRASPLPAEATARCPGLPDPAPAIHALVGFGSVGPWNTVVDLANPSAADAQVTYSTFFPFGPIKAPVRFLTVPANGTLTFTASGILEGRLGTLWLVDAGGLAISARAVSSAQPDVSLSLPVASIGGLLAAFPGPVPETLAFPMSGLAPSTGASLLLGEVGGCGEVAVSVRATGPRGDFLGSTELTIPSGGYVRVDGLASALGVRDLTGAQIRVVATGGPGLFWGEVVGYFGAGLRVVADGLPR